MGEVFVVNTSPVITLAKAGHLTLLTDLAEAILIPDAVVVEVLAGPESSQAGARWWVGHAGARQQRTSGRA